jgi:hypothetical protein
MLQVAMLHNPKRLATLAWYSSRTQTDNEQNQVRGRQQEEMPPLPPKCTQITDILERSFTFFC